MEALARARNRCGFSLVELLVVIGIIALLLAILLPSLTRARQSATTLVCLSNARQIGNALLLYANDNGGRLPEWSGIQLHPDGSPGPDAPGLGWTQQLQTAWDVAPDDDLYECPAFPQEARHNYFISAGWLESQEPTRSSLNLSEVRQSSTFVLSGDAVNIGFYGPPFGTSLGEYVDIDKDDATQQMLIFSGEPGGINVHEDRGLVVLFADQHAALMPKFDPSKMTFHPREEGQTWTDVKPED
jgi:prepilin-type N-terminal cleavage/methylation domain-containing protein